MSSAREKILNKLPDTKKSQKDLDANEDIYAKQDGSLLEIFKSELELVDGEVFITDTFSDLQSSIDKYISDNKFNNIYSNYSELKIDDSLTKIDKFSTEIEVAITTCEFLSARTGSVVVSSHKDGRRINIFAPTHIVIAAEDQILGDIDECINALISKYGNLPSSISFVTGPSRTADIEKTLILGAHGPKRLAVFINKNSK